MTKSENELTVPVNDVLKTRLVRLENIAASFAMRITDLESQVKNLRVRLDKQEAKN
ncbi:MAG: hypothetical protein KGL39_42595 [Patescibacteria group bacterium]|nr:hypothetical protein [Patescibacteria group bacterium]